MGRISQDSAAESPQVSWVWEGVRHCPAQRCAQGREGLAGRGAGSCPLTSKSWYCSSVSALLATTSVRRPSRAMFPHWESTGRSQARHGLGTPPRSLPRPSPGVGSGGASQRKPPPAPPARSSEEVLWGRPHAIALATARGQVVVVLFFKFGEKVYNQNSTRVLP